MTDRAGATPSEQRWPEIVTGGRWTHPAKRWLLLALFVALAAGCTTDGSTDATPARNRADQVSGPAEFDASTLPGSGIGPVASPAPDGTVYYATDVDGRPVIRARRPDGDEMTFVKDAYAPIVDAVGEKIAFGRPGSSTNTSSLMVRELSGGEERAVLEQVNGTVQPIFWAGDTLVSFRYDPERQQATYPFIRTGGVVDELPILPKAVSSDGTLIVGVGGTVDSYLEVLDGRTLETTARMSFDAFIDGFVDAERAAQIPRDHVPNTAEEEPLPVALGDNLGAWAGDRIVLLAQPTPIVVHLDGDELVAVGSLQLPTADADDRFYVTVRAVSDGEVAVRWVENSHEVAYLCSTLDLSCRDGGRSALDSTGPVWATSR
jgi:hypothetical protein